MRVRVLAVLLMLLFSCTAVHAWSNKEHMQLTRLAAERLIASAATPPDMKDWLRKALVAPPLTMDQEKEYFLHQRIGLIPRGVDGLPYWAVMPDMHALTDMPGKTVEPYGVPERLLHFLDIEMFMPNAADRSYVHDLSHKPKLADFPRDIHNVRYQRAGMLPFRVAECYQQLVDAIRVNKLLDTPGQYPRDEHATKWAGFLAHYAEDNTQPQHATMDYKSSAYFAEKRHAPNVHAEVEYKMCDDDYEDYPALRAEFWPAFVHALDSGKDPIETNDPWQATLEVSLASYDALPLIGLAAMAATGQAGTPAHPTGPIQPFDTATFFRFKGEVRGVPMTVSQMKAQQQAWAVHRVERLWLAAWKEAHEPPARPTTLPTSRP